MDTHISLRTLVQSYARWALVFTIPLIANVVLWHGLVAPQQSSLRAMQDARTIVALKPKLEALTAASRQLRAKAGQTKFTHDDPSAVMQMVQRLAGKHQVRVKELRSKGQEQQGAGRTVSGYSTVPLDLQVTGRFQKLAHWLSAVESQPGLQVESWTLAPAQDASQGTQLTVTLTAFLRNSPS